MMILVPSEILFKFVVFKINKFSDYICNDIMFVTKEINLLYPEILNLLISISKNWSWKNTLVRFIKEINCVFVDKFIYNCLVHANRMKDLIMLH